jgi:hypothetical protein
MTTPKRPVGRPRLPLDERTRSMHVAASPADWSRYEAAAAEDEVTVSEWIRDAAERKLKARNRRANRP